MSQIIADNCKKFSFTEDNVKMYCLEEDITVGDGIITFPVKE